MASNKTKSIDFFLLSQLLRDVNYGIKNIIPTQEQHTKRVLSKAESRVIRAGNQGIYMLQTKEQIFCSAA